MFDNRFTTVVYTEIPTVCYHYESVFLSVFSSKYIHFKIKPLKIRLKKNERSG